MSENAKQPSAFKQKMGAFVNEKVIPAAGKLGNQIHLATIRDAFAMLLPVLLAGAFAVLLNQVLFGSSKLSLAYWFAYWSGNYRGFTATGDIIHTVTGAKALGAFASINGGIWEGTFMVITLYLVFTLAYVLAKKRGNESPIIAGTIGLGAFLSSGAAIAPWGYGIKFMSTEGLFPGIIIGFLAAELFCVLSKTDKLSIKMPEQVPPSVARAFERLLPGILTLLIFSSVSVFLFTLPTQYGMVEPANAGNYNTDNFAWRLFMGVEGGEGIKPENAKPLSLVTFLFRVVAMPFVSLASSKEGGLGLAIVYIFFVSLLWFFGLHGTNIVNGVFLPVWSTLQLQNVAALEAGLKPEHIFNGTFFDGFIFFGGWGLSLSLLIATRMFGNDKTAREVSKLSIAPALFNINEPVTFGYPLMLNPIFAIPSILGPVVLVITTYVWLLITGIRPVLPIPWISPPGIGAVLTTLSGWAFVIALFNLVVGILIYIPFIMIANSKAKKEGTAVQITWWKNLKGFVLKVIGKGEPKAEKVSAE